MEPTISMQPLRNGTAWSREELILAFNLYCQIPFGLIHSNNPCLVEFAALLGRTPSSIALRLVNFASHDPALQARGVRGMSGGGRAVGAIWAEFADSPEGLAYESERLLAERLGKRVEDVAGVEPEEFPPGLTGAERDALVKVRINQHFFRKRILSAYGFRCCVTGLTVRPLLVASHIVPWAADPKNRLNPRNGLCLNALHDRAFDRGLIWVDGDFRVRLSSRLKAEVKALEWFTRVDGQQLLLPQNFSPDPQLLQQHMQKALSAA